MWCDHLTYKHWSMEFFSIYCPILMQTSLLCCPVTSYSSWIRLGEKYHPLLFVCTWLWENPPLTHEVKYWEIRNSTIQSVMSREGLQLQACNLLWIYNYLIAIRLLIPQCTASWFSQHFDCFYQHHKHLYRVEGEWWVATKWRVTAELSNFLGEMA